MKTTEQKIYGCLARVARMEGVALMLSTPIPTPELVLQFLQSVIKAEERKKAAGRKSDEGIDVHILKGSRLSGLGALARINHRPPGRLGNLN